VHDISKLMKALPLGYIQQAWLTTHEIRSVVVQHQQVKFAYSDLGEIQHEPAYVIGRTIEGFKLDHGNTANT
jgi:hypothetical protein